MINLFLNNGELEVYDGQDITLTYTPIRFCDALTDPYTTDIELPNNRHNITLLSASGLLDSDRRYGRPIKPCLLSLNGELMDVYMQVNSITNDTITVTLFERTIDTETMNKTILDLVQDDQFSIYPWYKDSVTDFPNVFKKYVNGLYGFTDYCQVHQSRNVNDIIDILSLASHYELPYTDPKLWMTATNKNICPQNKRQVLEITFKKNEVMGYINGGGHVTNDLEWSWDPSEQKITFNRHCVVSMTIYLSYGRKNNFHPTSQEYFETILRRPDNTPVQDHPTEMPLPWYNAVVTDTYTTPQTYITQDTTLEFRITNMNRYDYANAVIIMDISNYDIVDDDYGLELSYVARYPKLLFWTATQHGQDLYMYFDGRTYQFVPSISEVVSITLPKLSFSYLGFYCNLPKITLKELLYGLCFLNEKKFLKVSWQYLFLDAYDKKEIDGVITEFDPSNDELGIKNHLLFSGEEENNYNTVCTVDNDWLESSVVLHQSPFAYSLRRYGTWAYFPQYSNKEYDEEKGEYKCDYEDVDGLPITKIEPNTPDLLQRVELPEFGFEELTESTTVEIETYDDVRRLDYVYLHGRKFMVQEIETELNSGLSTIKAVEIWKTNEPSELNWPPTVEINDIFNISGTNANITFTITEN